ncbi:MAG: hypothetical protein WCH43_02650, partial [Verrucomicrobiota bacterium]
MKFCYPPSHHADRQQKGVALVIVLAMVVLVTGLVVAFFSRAMNTRQVSNSSAAQAKAELIARSAADNIISDFKSEIALGSSANTLTIGTAQTILYIPTSNTNMIPARSGSAATVSGTANLLQNLIRYSSRTAAPSYSGTMVVISGSASAVNSYSDPSANGSKISPARWNSHYLISCSNAAISSTPISQFVAPDWVYLTRSGPKATGTAPYVLGSGPTTLNNPIISNSNYVVGRYAYAVYDEGGLLDINVAGHPTSLSSTMVARKGALALADLTILPISTGTLTNVDVDNIVGWRNYATGTPTGNYGNFSFNATSGSTWLYNFVTTNTTGFITTGTFPSPGGQTDQTFISRQQLINLAKSIASYPRSSGSASLLNSLQYLGTFSRALEQPSFAPKSNRPRIVNNTLAPTTDNTYMGNNNGAGAGLSPNPDDVINPSLLTMRVLRSFTRLDGSVAQVGDPLISKKFALSRLSLLSSAATANASAGDAIYDRFGLSRSNPTQPWTYGHGAAKIMRLDEVQQLNPAREPDFAELLKAAISAGSLGKAGPNGGGHLYNFNRDVNIDFHVLQIMANIIDQSKSDSFPTRIQLTGNTTYTFSGVEDLPYFYRLYEMAVTTRRPTPNLGINDTVTWHNQTLTKNLSLPIQGDAIGHHVKYASNGQSDLSDPGSATLFLVPEVWNPHDPNAPVSNSRPTWFRIIAESNDPVGS